MWIVLGQVAHDQQCIAFGNRPGFVQLIESMRHGTTGCSLAEIAEHVIEKSGIVAHYEAEREGQERIENLRELLTSALDGKADKREVVVTGFGREDTHELPNSLRT